MATDTPNTGRDSDKFMLRFPDGMRDRLKEAAKANNRTMNAEIVARLQDSLTPKLDGSWKLDGSKTLGLDPSDDLAEKVAEKLITKLGKMIPIPLEDLEAATPDYAKPGFRKSKSSKSS